MAASDARARGLGFKTPTGQDLINTGDNDISQNARATVDLFDKANATVDNLAATAETLPPGTSATVTVTGLIPNKVINIGVPRGADGLDGRPGRDGIGADEGAQLVGLAESAQSASAQSATYAADAVTLAQQAQAAKLEVPDANVSALVGNPSSETHTALAEAFTPIDAPGFDVILLAGQSNMSGRGVPFDTATTDHADTRVYQYGAHGRITALATEPLDMHDVPSGIGPGLGFARWYASRIATGRRVLLVPAAHGGTGFGGGALRWLTTHTPDDANLYRQAIRQTREALAAAGPGARLTAILWHQGEFDSITTGRAGNYEASLDALIDGFRDELGAVPFILGQMVPDHLGTDERATVNAIHADTPNRHAGTAFAHGLRASYIDGDHYDSTGQRFLARSMFEQYTALRDEQPTPAPETPTGLTNDTPEATTITVRWDRCPLAIGYTLEWRPSGDPLWREVATLTNTVTLTGLDPALTHLIRVRSYNSAAASPYSATINPSTSAGADLPPLDEVTAPALRAYGTRRLSSTYTGPALRVRRSTDGAFEDIGFTGDDLDTAALTAFVGSGDGHVIIWYDQTGNTSNVSQVGNSAQGRIVIGGTLQTRNGRPVAVLDGVDDYWQGAAGMYAAGSATAALVAHIEPGATDPRVIAEGGAESSQQYAVLIPRTADGNAKALIRDDTAATLLSTSGATGPSLTGALRQIALTDTGDSLNYWIDGTHVPGGTYTRAPATFTKFTIGALSRNTVSSHAPMAFGELVVWAAALTDTERGMVRTNQRTQWGTA